MLFFQHSTRFSLRLRFWEVRQLLWHSQIKHLDCLPGRFHVSQLCIFCATGSWTLFMLEYLYKLPKLHLIQSKRDLLLIFWLNLFSLYSFCCHVDIRCCEWNFTDFISTLLCWCRRGTDAGDSHHDSNPAIYTDTGCVGNFIGMFSCCSIFSALTFCLYSANSSYQCYISSSVTSML